MATRKSSHQGFTWRFIFVFILSAMLVTLFWYHEELYQLGLGMLILITGLAMALITWLGVFIFSDSPVLRRKVVGTLFFRDKEKEQILQGKKKLEVIPAGEGKTPEIESLCRAGVAGAGEYFTTLHINDVYRTLLGDLSYEELKLAGLETKEAFERDWTRRYKEFDVEQIVYLVKFDVQKED